MSKSNNKGISLIDVIIAVAVLSILISPIIHQVITTVDTSSKAKEKQYVIDDAEKVMEYFRSNSIKELSEKGYKGDDVVINDVTEGKATVFAWTYDSLADVTPGNFPLGASGFDYNYTDFELGTYDKATASISPYEILGRENNRYTRTVTIDDMNNVLLESNSRVLYCFKDSAYSDVVSELLDDGYEITSDGAAVKYDSNGHVNNIVCVKSDSTYTNPNSATPLITDIDSEKMAIIEGDASSIDNQFQEDFIANMMSIVMHKKKELEAQPYGNGQTMYDYYLDKDNLNDAFDDARQSNDFYRMIKLSVKAEDVVGGKPTRYRVKCEVYYKAQYTFIGESFGTDSDNEKFRYTVFDRTFHTAEPPDVFFIYEPFVKKTDASYYSYAGVDYILIESDSYTSGVYADYDPSKVYLIKADSSWAEEVVNKLNATAYDDGVARSISEDKKRNDSDLSGQKYYNYFYNVVGAVNYPVEININQIKNNSDSEALPLQIITNISWRPNDASNSGYVGDNTIINKGVYIGGTDYRQFNLDTTSDAFKPNPGIDTSSQSIVAYPNRTNDTHIDRIVFPTDTERTSVYAVDVPTSDTVEYGRLYSMTVKYHNEDRASEADVYTYFTGAKGAD